MNVETLQAMSHYAYIIAGILFIISVFLFIIFNIPKLFNEITGRATKKFIANANKKNEIMASENQEKSAYATSGQLISSDLITAQQKHTVSKVMTTKLISQQGMKHSDENLVRMQENTETELPVVSQNIGFSVIQEFSFTSSTEIIE